MALLQVENLSFTYPDGHRALTEVSLALLQGSFTLLCGASGSGKSTLLRLLKTPIAPTGEMSGEIVFDGQAYPLPERVSAAQIGFVGQDPDGQIVTDRVWQELAFGLENLGLDSAAIRRRVGEMASYFGMESWYHRETDTLSGGQKQLLNLAAVLVTRPKLLLLDEPTAQLDPIAATEFLSTLRRLNRDMGITVLMTEHRLEETLPVADGVIVLEDGKVAFTGEPRAACAFLRQHPLSAALPAAARIWSGLGVGGDCPLTVQEGQRLLASLGAPTALPVDAAPAPTDVALHCQDAWFRYEKNGVDVLRGVSLAVGRGEVYSLLGGNGAGKTTLLCCLAKTERLYKGHIKASGRVAFLPQDPRMLFACETVREELSEMAMDWQAVAETEGLIHLLDRHPYDLSGGEQQRVALAKLLLTRPDILLLDEPTKGLDAGYKQALVTHLRELAAAGTAMLAVTHDVDFAAEVSDRCGMLFDGEIISEDVPRRFFGDNCFYTTAACRIAREFAENPVTCAQVVDSWAER